MSKLAKALQVSPTKVRRIGSSTPLVDSIVKTDYKLSEHTVATMLEHRFSCLFEVKRLVPESANQSFIREIMLADARRHVVEAVFGEFREDLFKLRELLSYDMHSREGLEIVDNILNEMFTV